MFVARRALAIVGVLVHLAGGIFFIVVPKRIDVLVWALLGCFLAAFNFYECQHRVRCARNNTQPEDHIIALRVAGVVGGLGGLLAFITYVAIALENNDGIGMHTYWIPAVWSLLLFKWGLITAVFADSLAKADQAAKYPTLIKNPNAGSVAMNGGDGPEHTYSGLPLGME